MEHTNTHKTKTRLPLYILAGLLAGTVLGVVLHTNYLADDNTTIQTTERGLQEISGHLSRESDSSARLLLEQQHIELSQQHTAVLAARDKRVEPFSLLADMFLRLIKMIVAPLVFTTLVVGVAKLGDINSVGRIGAKTLAWFFSASFMSLLLGMIVVNVLKPGEAMNLPLPYLHEQLDLERGDFSLKNFLHHVFPSSVIDAMAKNDILQIVVFSLLFGVATAALGERGHAIIHFSIRSHKSS